MGLRGREEGDHGIVKYYLCDTLVAVKTVHGGDVEDVEFTQAGTALMWGIMHNIFRKLK